MKYLVTLYAIEMLTIIGYGLYHAPFWLRCILCASVGAMGVALLVEHFRRPVLVGGSER